MTKEATIMPVKGGSNVADQHLVRCFFGPCCKDTRFYERFLVIYDER